MCIVCREEGGGLVLRYGKFNASRPYIRIVYINMQHYLFVDDISYFARKFIVLHEL